MLIITVDREASCSYGREYGVELPRAHLRLIALDVTHGRTLTHAPGYYFKVAEWTPLAVFDQGRIGD